MKMTEIARRALVIVVAGPFLIGLGIAWFAVAFPLTVLIYLVVPRKEWWLWRHLWSVSIWPFFSFWCLLTGYTPPDSEFWR